MFGISAEHLVILAIVLLLFGPRRLPELGYTLGKAIRNFKDSLAGVEEARFRRVEQGEGAPAVTAQAAAAQDAKAPGVASSTGADGANANGVQDPAPTVRA